MFRRVVQCRFNLLSRCCTNNTHESVALHIGFSSHGRRRMLDIHPTVIRTVFAKHHCRKTEDSQTTVVGHTECELNIET